MRHPHGEDFWGILLLGKMRTTLRGVEPSVVKLLGALYEPKTSSASLPGGDTRRAEHGGGAPAHGTAGRYVPTSP